MSFRFLLFRKLFLFIFSLVIYQFVLLPVMAEPQKVYSWKQAEQHVGETIIVEGKIIATRNIGKITFLNFSKIRGDFTLVVFQENYGKFDVAPVKKYRNKLIRVRGQVDAFRGNAQIKVSSPAQIIIRDEVARPLKRRGSKSSKVISWQDAPNYYGRSLFVEGKIVRAFYLDESLVICFHNNYKRYLNVIVPRRFLKDNMPEDPELFLEGRDLRVKGLIEKNQGIPILRVKKVSDLKWMVAGEQISKQAVAEVSEAVAPIVGAAIFPNPPVRGRKARIVYNSAGRNLEWASSVYIHLGFNNWNPARLGHFKMKTSGGGIWTYDLMVGEGDKSLDFVFNDEPTGRGGIWDNNSGKDWYFQSVSGSR